MCHGEHGAATYVPECHCTGGTTHRHQRHGCQGGGAPGRAGHEGEQPGTPVPEERFGREEGPSSQRRSRKLGFPANSIQYLGELFLLGEQVCKAAAACPDARVSAFEKLGSSWPHKVRLLPKRG